jgi:hypothetical protein
MVMKVKRGFFSPGWDLNSCSAASAGAMTTLCKAAALIWGGRERFGSLPRLHEWLGVTWMHALPASLFVGLTRGKALGRKVLAK